MRWRFLTCAAAEYFEAAQRYTDIEPKLGASFVECFEAGIEQIVSNPEAWPEVEPGIRRHLIKRFPYGIFYRQDGDLLLIAAVMHTKRRPGRWRHRLP